MTRVAAWLGVRLDRIAGRWDRFAEGVSDRWYRLVDGIAGRWDRVAEGVSDRWYRLVDRIAGRRERVTESISIGWNRLTNRRRGRGVSTDWSGGSTHRSRVVERIVVLALIGIVGVASMGALSALRDAGGERNVDPSAHGASSDRAVEGPGGIGVAPDERPPGADGSREQLGAFSVYRDERTGYRFSYPRDWEVSASRGITRLADAAGEIVISFRTSPNGSIEDFSERLMGILASRYAPVDLVAREDGETPQGEPSLVLGGRATDTDGSSINFMIVVIEGPDRNRGITVRFSGDSDLLDVSSWIRRIAGSFRTSALATAA